MSDRIRRTFDFDLTRAEPGDDGLTIEGYAAVFDQWTEIHGEFSGPFMERIAPGAFSKTLSERMPVMQFDHGTHPLVGSIPIGVPTQMYEDERGLFVRGRLHDNWLIEPVRDAIRDGSISGMSFRFSVPRGKDKWEDNNKRRTIHEVRLFELGPVVFPAYAGTAVGVRSELAGMLADETIQRDLARMLAFGQRNQISVEPEAEPITSEETPDEPPVQALSGRTQKQRRYLADRATEGLRSYLRAS